MGQFKPMVKMYTDEPSVILKLKKGGKVKGQADGFKSMSHTSGGNPFDAAESGKAPKKPSMSERRKAMNPNQYAHGGKVADKQMGGVMPVVQNPAGSNATGVNPMRAMGRSALAGMAPAARMARAAAVRKALTGMKKGGSADCSSLEKELEQHKAMSASKAHGKASGGAIDAAETKTTLKNSVKPYAKTKMDTAKKDRTSGPTGEVKEGVPGGYKMGGTIEGNEGPYENTKMNTAGKGKTNGTTGGVRMGNAGGFKNGGKAMKYAAGGTIEGGNWENRPANTSKPGVKNTTTGEVKKANAGGYKMGGAAKKAYATGGNVVDDGKAEKMPRHSVSRPVANSLQSGTFKKGGKVARKAEGGDMSKGAYDRSREIQRKENEEDREAILGFPRRMYEGAKKLFSGTPAPAASAAKTPGAVTETEKSITVAPRKRGGSAKC
jgi:hypothetical protein